MLHPVTIKDKDGNIIRLVESDELHSKHWSNKHQQSLAQAYGPGTYRYAKFAVKGPVLEFDSRTPQKKRLEWELSSCVTCGTKFPARHGKRKKCDNCLTIK